MTASRPGFARVPVLGLLSALWFLAGCGTPPVVVDPLTRSYRPDNVRPAEALPEDIRRVVVLPVWSQNGVPTRSLEPIDQAWLTALTRAARFEVVPVTRSDLHAWVRHESLATTGLLPADLFVQLRERTAADAVLLIDLTHYTPYPPLALGLRARLVRLDTGTDLWAIDELFDAADGATAAAARRHHLRGAPAPADPSRIVLQSPARFAAYASDAVAATLPPRRP